MKQQILYYRDEINDEFADIKRDPPVIDGDYKYINKNILWKIAKFFVYRIVMTPFSYFYSKLKFGVKVKNKKVLKQYRKSGYFMFANHTQVMADAFFPNIISFPKDVYVLVNPDSLALRGTRNLMKMLGAMPIPSTLAASKNFVNAISEHIEKKRCVMVYPEAHIWPYYTGIRPFKDVSFKYPMSLNAPSFCFTTVYKKRRFTKVPRVILYVDGPFLPSDCADKKQAKKQLRDDIYMAMKKRSLESDCEYVRYIKVSE